MNRDSGHMQVNGSCKESKGATRQYWKFERRCAGEVLHTVTLDQCTMLVNRWIRSRPLEHRP